MLCALQPPKPLLPPCWVRRRFTLVLPAFAACSSLQALASGVVLKPATPKPPQLQNLTRHRTAAAHTYLNRYDIRLCSHLACKGCLQGFRDDIIYMDLLRQIDAALQYGEGTLVPLLQPEDSEAAEF